jgi:Na+/H+ antiporter NhaD/arsenite permease-like protein
MESLQIIASSVFLGSIFLVITGWIDSVIAALLGIFAMIFLGVMTEVQAFQFVDWNVILILLSIWIIAGYFGKTGVPEFLAAIALRMSKGNVAVFVTSIGVLAGFVSMLIDNVVVVLMFAPVIFHACRRFKFDAFGPVLFVGLCANFMGTALLLGDLPPQMLHSVSKIEFGGFLWHSGRPSSFFILCGSYLVTVAFFYWKFSKMYEGKRMDFSKIKREEKYLEHIKDKRFALVVCGIFFLTILAMANRPLFGVCLGYIALCGALTLVLVFEIFRKGFLIEIPSFEEILSGLDWRAIFFYISLFALVGGLDHAGVIKKIAEWITPLIQSSLLAGSSLLYWITAPIVGIVEHDAYILTMLYVIRDLGKDQGINPWPLYWTLLWAGTLGSNLTIAGAPALFVAKNLGEKEDQKKATLKEFFSYSVPYVIVSLISCYLLAILIWVLPFQK